LTQRRPPLAVAGAKNNGLGDGSRENPNRGGSPQGWSRASVAGMMLAALGGAVNGKPLSLFPRSGRTSGGLADALHPNGEAAPRLADV
jgi:hypothetical protein